MASSLEVIRQRITSPGVRGSGPYPVPPPAQRRLIPSSAMAGSQTTTQNRLLPAGFTGRHSWTPICSPPNALLNNRIQRLNLRVSPPTPGEEDLCRHWMQNSAKYSRRLNPQRSAALPINSKSQGKKLERPRTVQTPPGHYKDLNGQRVKSAGKTKLRVVMTSPNQEHITSSDSERIASPSASHRSSPTAGMRKLGSRFASARQSSPSSFCRGETPGNSPNNDLPVNHHDSGDARSQPRPPSARPSEARWRNRARASYSPPNMRTGSAGKSKGNSGTDVRRWSLSEAMMNQQNDSKDDDSAYSSSREVTIHTDRLNGTPPDPPGSPPRSAPNLQSREEHHNLSSTKLSRAKGQVSRVMVSGQDGRPVFYYHQNQNENRQLLRHGTGESSSLLPLRQAGNTQRPRTQPAMGKGTQHSRTTYQRRPNGSQNGISLEDKLAQRVLSQRLPPATENKNNTNSMMQYHVGPNFYPISLNDYDALNKQRMSIVKEQNNLTKSVNHYIDPEVGQRIIQWLASVEHNPDLYYGFETDLFSGSIKSFDSK